MLKKREKQFAAVFAYLRDGDYVNVVRSCERAEMSPHPLSKALSAFAYYRSGGAYREQALALASDALAPVDGRPCTDARVLATVACVWRPAGLGATLAAAYDAASAAEPTDVRLAHQLALAYAFAGDWRRMQQASLRLLKLTSRPLYALWAAAAIHVMAAGPCALGDGIAPVAITGGGRRFAMDVPPPDAARPLALAQTVLSRALAAAPPSARDAELLGLNVHSLVRLGRPLDAFRALVECASAPTAAAATCAPPPAAAISDVADAASVDAKASLDALLDALGETPYPFADGKEGRGAVPSPLQPVDDLRLRAYILTECAIHAGAAGAAPSAGPGSWEAAREACAELGRGGDSGDWATLAGIAVASAKVSADALGAFLSSPTPASVASLAWLEPVDHRGVFGVVNGGAHVRAIDAAVLIPCTVELARAGASSWASGAASAWPAGVWPADAPIPATPSPTRTRSAALVSIVSQATRAELLARAGRRARGDSSLSSLVEPLAAAAARAADAFAVLVIGYAVTRGGLACAASDLRALLAPFASDDAEGGAAAESAPAPPLDGFIAANPTLLSSAFAPVANVGGSSDASLPEEPFSWSFRVSAAARAAFIADLHAAALRNVPDAPLRDAVHGALARAHESRDAARKLAQKKADDALCDESGGASSATDDAADPHRVRSILSPTGAFEFVAADAALVSAARASVRRYTNAALLLRMLGAYGSSPTALAAALRAGAAADTVFSESRRLVAATTDAWLCALPLLTAAAELGAEKDVGDGDELALLAAHICVDAAFARLAAGTGDGGDVDAAAVEAAHGHFLEALSLLEQGAAASVHNAQFQVAAVRVHGWLGGVTGMISDWVKLRVKHLINDVQLFNILPHCSRFLWLMPLRARIFEPINALAREAELEVPTAVVTALSGGFPSSAFDTLRFRTRLQHSATFACVRAVAATVQLAAGLRGNPADTAALLETVAVPPAQSGAPALPSQFFFDTRAAAMLRLRSNEDRSFCVSWDALTGDAASDARGGASAVHAAAAAVVRASIDAPSSSAPVPDEDAPTLGWMRAAAALPRPSATPSTPLVSPPFAADSAADAIRRRASRDFSLSFRSAIFSALHAVGVAASAPGGAAAAAAATAVARAERLAAEAAGRRADAPREATITVHAFASHLAYWSAAGVVGLKDVGVSGARPGALSGGTTAILAALRVGEDAVTAAAAASSGDAETVRDAAQRVAAGAAFVATSLAGALTAACAMHSLPPTADRATPLIDARFFADLSFLLLNAAPAVGTALSSAIRALTAAERVAGAAGGGARGKAASAAPLAAAGGAAPALVTVRKALTALGAAALALARATDATSDVCRELNPAINSNDMAKAMKMIAGGWGPGKEGPAWAPCIRDQVVDWANDDDVRIFICASFCESARATALTPPCLSLHARRTTCSFRSTWSSTTYHLGGRRGRRAARSPSLRSGRTSEWPHGSRASPRPCPRGRAARGSNVLRRGARRRSRRRRRWPCRHSAARTRRFSTKSAMCACVGALSPWGFSHFCAELTPHTPPPRLLIPDCG